MGRAPSVNPPPTCPALQHLGNCQGWDPGEVAPNGTGDLADG